MLTFTSGDDVTIVVPFKVDGEFATPDASSVFYDLRGNDGTKLINNTALTPAAGATEVAITILAANNTKTLTSEQRHLVVRYSVDGHPYTFRLAYRLTGWLNFSASPDDVRAAIGATSSELPDADIDLVDAYLVIDEQMGGTYLPDALAAGGLFAKFANDAIAYRAAYELIPSMHARMVQQEQAGTFSYKRYSKMNFDQLRLRLLSKIGEAIAHMTNQSETTPALLVGGARTDVVTNA